MLIQEAVNPEFTEEKNCFICAESTGILYKVCKCNTFIHENCMNALINKVTTHNQNCPVCLQQYQISKRRNGFEVNFDNTRVVIFVLSMIASSFIIIPAGIYVIHTSAPNTFIFTVIGYIFVVLGSLWFLFTICFIRNKLCTCRRKYVRKVEIPELNFM